MKITLLFFGMLTDLSGTRRMDWETSGDWISLKKELVSRWPALETQPVMWALNQQVIKDNCVLKTGDEIALMPPFAGG